MAKQTIYKPFLTLSLLFISLLSHSQSHRSDSYTVSGRVLTDNDGEAASFAIVSIQQIELRTICDIDGYFQLQNVPKGFHLLQIESLGFAPLKKQINVSADISLSLKLQSSTFALPEFEVMSKRGKRGKVVIDQSALEYIQPTSIADVMLLLPGNVYKENNLTRFSKMTSRQVGEDANTSLGIGIVTDGAPMSNDGIRSQLVGVTVSNSNWYDTEITRRSGINQGNDMRYMSTDHIQSVEFTQGISSARFGNLSSGMISITSKHGVTPLRVRLKTDLKTKLFYLGKGWRLGERTGTLHAGIDYLNSINDVREETDKFSRLTGQLYYNNKVILGKYELELDGRLSETMTVNKMKKDELIYEYDERYKADYSRTALMLKGNLLLHLPLIEQIEMIVSGDYTLDKIKRHKMVLSSSGPLNVPLAYEEGEHEGLYLPGKYYSDFAIDNKPLNLFLQFNATSRWNLFARKMLKIQYGIEYTNVKNHGQGAVVYDELRPPFPYDNSYMRPRPNNSIPALGTGSAYIQTDFTSESESGNVVLISLGGRTSMLMNIPGNYLLHGKPVADPRINASYTFGRSLRNTIRLGYGEETKMPTLDYLYPEKLYKDFYMLNAYTDDERYRHLITYTNVYNMTNVRLKPNKNRKFEMGWDADYRGVSLSLTAFYEHSSTGYEYFTKYHPLAYDLYTTLRPDADISNRRPEKHDYFKEKYNLFTTSQQVMNSSSITKRGVEYRIIIPKIMPLQTSIEINGAYYQTDYSSSLPLYDYPNVKIAGNEYPFVGVYNNNARNQYRRLNTNIWFNTHIPQFKFFVTNFFQVVWLNTSQYKDNYSYTPQEIIDMNDQIIVVDANMTSLINDNDPTYRYLKRTILPVNYAKNEKPISFLWNIKATKEFRHGAKLSFFVNGLLDINPKYLSGSKITQREWNDPYFGFELSFNLEKMLTLEKSK